MGRKIIALFIGCWLLFGSARAQYVPIPDGNFMSFLATSSFFNCVETGQLDTTCAELFDDTILVCSHLYISNLQGIQYFKGLRYLDCSYNLMDSLPPLPSGLHQLICNMDSLRSLPQLPDSLILVNCADNKLISITALPPGISNLDCQSNQISKFPALPLALVIFNCSFNSLDSLPILPNHLDSLNCYGNQLIFLPLLPNSLRWLDCSQNQLNTVPVGASLKYLGCGYNSILSLPEYDSLEELDCGQNQLHRLPLFPNSLTTLFCGNNFIDSIFSLPNWLITMYCEENQIASLGLGLPDSLKVFNCGNNKIQVLPALPKGLLALACDHNLLTELPDLPDTMSALDCNANPFLQCLPKLTRIDNLNFDSTAVTCLPNYGQVTTSTPLLSSLPLCGLNNPKGCPEYASVAEIKDLDFSIYPNPACDYVLVTLNENRSALSMAIIDVTGRLIMSVKAVTDNYELPVSQLPAGLYFVKLSNERGGIGVKKLVIEH